MKYKTFHITWWTTSIIFTAENMTKCNFCNFGMVFLQHFEVGACQNILVNYLDPRLPRIHNKTTVHKSEVFIKISKMPQNGQLAHIISTSQIKLGPTKKEPNLSKFRFLWIKVRLLPFFFVYVTLIVKCWIQLTLGRTKKKKCSDTNYFWNTFLLKLLNVTKNWWGSMLVNLPWYDHTAQQLPN